MRCLSCNCKLSDKESTRRHVSTGEFLDMCNRCYAPISDVVPTYDRFDADDEEDDPDNDVFDDTWDSDPYDEGAADFIREHFDDDQ
jgi:hypothetical protein